MKIRNGFVSNSSSSSFIITGKLVNDIDELINMVNDNKIIFMIGDYPREGLDIFEVKRDYLKYIDKSFFECFDFIYAYDYFDNRYKDCELVKIEEYDLNEIVYVNDINNWDAEINECNKIGDEFKNKIFKVRYERDYHSSNESFLFSMRYEKYFNDEDNIDGNKKLYC